MKENGGRLLDKIKRHYGRYIRSFFFLTIGAILAAYALEAFLIPNTILDGGVTGVSTILT